MFSRPRFLADCVIVRYVYIFLICGHPACEARIFFRTHLWSIEMSETTVESFVKKLQNEGVEAGQKEAEKLRSEAEKEKQDILEKANAEAEKIKSDAQVEAGKTLEKSKNELELAARDAALKLKDTLERALREIIAKPVKDELSKPDFLKQLIEDVVSKYADADAKNKTGASISLSPELAENLGSWAAKELGKACEGSAGVDVKENLKQAGFEYNLSGGTVEVTEASVVEILGDMLSERLREMLTKAMQKES